LVLASSGDYAYDDELYHLTQISGGAAPSYPASSPYVMAVGGTALYWNGSSAGEGVWEGTTSGCSTEFAMPPWQAPVLARTACTARATADVSAMAAFFYNGVEIGLEAIVGGKALVTDGTSASAPLVAGIFTRLGLTTEMSNDLSWAYTNSSAFNDVGSPSYPIPAKASNTNARAGSSCGILCTAGTGWDGPSGVGSPNGTKLAALPVSTAGPQRYPDAGICGPYGACGTVAEGTDEDGPTDGPERTDRGETGAEDAGAGTGPSGCACGVGSPGRSPGTAWAMVVFCLAFFGVFRRERVQS
jgi:MYXO-CTERM domain-containing protein